MQQPVYSDKPGNAASGWQPDRDEDYSDDVRLAANAPAPPPNPTRSAFGPTQNMLIEQCPVSPASYAPTRQAVPQVPAASYQAIMPAPPASPEVNLPVALLEAGPFRTVMLPTLQAPLTTLSTMREATLEAHAVGRWGVIGRIAALVFTLALLTLIFRKVWPLWAIIWTASILGIISWHRQRHPKYGPVGGILEFNFEIVLGVLWLLGNIIVFLLSFVG